MSKGNHSFYIHYQGGTSKFISLVVFYGSLRKSYTSLPIIENTWYQLTGVFDGTEIVLYVNGVRQDNTSSLTGFLASNLDFNIGRNSEECSRYLMGTMDEVEVSNTARSADWIK